MVKKALSLQECLSLQKTLSTIINNMTYSIIKNNASLKGSEEESVDVVELYKKLDLAYDQLVIIKNAKHVANGKKSSLGCTNQELIFEKSSLEEKKSLLETLSNDKLKARKGGEANRWKFKLSKVDIGDDLIKVEDRITKIKQAMTKFNSKTIKIKFHEELELI